MTWKYTGSRLSFWKPWMTPGGQAMHSQGPSRCRTCRPVSSSMKTVRMPCSTKKISSTSCVCAALPWPGGQIDDAQREGARRDDARVVVLPRAAGADKAVLGAAVAVDLRVLEGLPIRDFVAEPPDIALGDLLERQRGDLGRHLVAGGSHHGSPSANGLHVISVGRRPCRARPWRRPRPCRRRASPTRRPRR